MKKYRSQNWSADLDIGGHRIKYIELNNPMSKEELDDVVDAYIQENGPITLEML